MNFIAKKRKFIYNKQKKRRGVNYVKRYKPWYSKRERERERELTFNKINNNKLNIDYNIKDSDKSLRN